LLENFKKIKIIILLSLVLGVFTNSTMDEICFCGSACANSITDHPEPKTKKYPIHHHCLGDHCKSCNLEDGQTLKAKNSRTSQAGSNFSSPFVPLIVSGTDSLYAQLYETALFADRQTNNILMLIPIYLKNQSLLC